MVVWRPLLLVGKLEQRMPRASWCCALPCSPGTGSLRQSLCKAHPFTRGLRSCVWLMLQSSCGLVSQLSALASRFT